MKIKDLICATLMCWIISCSFFAYCKGGLDCSVFIGSFLLSFFSGMFFAIVVGAGEALHNLLYDRDVPKF